MWIYEKSGVSIKSRTGPGHGKVIITQYGGPDGELAASFGI